MRGRTFIAVLLATVFAATIHASDRRRALLIGINDYSASRLPPQQRGAPADRAWSNLDGAVNDVDIMRDLLVALYGFKPADIVTLTDQQASRAAILRALKNDLLATTGKGDVVFFYFSGHGSQVRNSLSSEADRLDESLLPADSRRGAEDIRDKELLPYFNAILDRGARLTIVLDTCHSGSGARGLDGGMRYRAVAPELRDVADPSVAARPEQRGALILSAAQDFDLAFETLDESGKVRGAFTWALARALRDAAAGEPARDTFLRARARLHAERPAQDPVLAGRADVRRSPFLGIRVDRRNDRPVIAVEKEIGAGTYLLEGGWASGLTIGSELRLVDAEKKNDVMLEITSLLGVAQSVACIRPGTRVDSTRLHSGALLELATWAAPPSPPLRVWIPRAAGDVLVDARALHGEAMKRGICWIDDPTETTPAHLLRWRDAAWELVTDGHSNKAASSALAGVPRGASLFVQFPASAQLIDAIGGIDGVELTPVPETADYLLAGRLAQNRIEYAWVRPDVTSSDRARSVLPIRTAWADAHDASALREGLVRLRRVQGWHALRSPAGAGSHYRLAVRRTGDDTLVEDGKLVGEKRYSLVLRECEHTRSAPLYSRYVYLFVIDSDGTSVLLFPGDSGSVENLLPFTSTPGKPLPAVPAEIPLVGARPFVVSEPYGVDTYFVLSTDEPLPNLGSLEWRGVRAPRSAPKNCPLEDLLALTIAGTRAPDEPIRTPPDWSIEKVVFESVPPKRAAR